MLHSTPEQEQDESFCCAGFSWGLQYVVMVMVNDLLALFCPTFATALAQLVQEFESTPARDTETTSASHSLFTKTLLIHTYHNARNANAKPKIRLLLFTVDGGDKYLSRS